MNERVPLEPYDRSAFEAFLAAIKARGFGAVAGTNRRSWRGPVPDSLTEFTQCRRMTITFRDGWPFRAPQVFISGMSSEHVGPQDEVCLWADDDPAQQNAVDADYLFERLDAWAAAARAGFDDADRALDAHLYFSGHHAAIAELDVPALLRSPRGDANGPAYGERGDILVTISGSRSIDSLQGQWYFRTGAITPPRHLDDFIRSLKAGQRRNFERGLAKRADVDFGVVSGGHDLAVLLWQQHDSVNALVLLFSGTGTGLKAAAIAATPRDDASVKARSGRDARLLSSADVMIVGAGALGGLVALTLAESGVGRLTLCDSDVLTSVNVVRHVAGARHVGQFKTAAVADAIASHSRRVIVNEQGNVPLDPTDLMSRVAGLGLVVDCTGNAAVSAALAVACREEATPLIVAALYRSGDLIRVRRQAEGDTPLTERSAATGKYPPIPRRVEAEPRPATFLELGCSAPVHNASPAAVLRGASLTCLVCVDLLTGRREYPDEVVDVLGPVGDGPYGTLGTRMGYGDSP